MKILAFNAYYEPEKAASIYLPRNIYEGFAEHGWDTALFVPVPTRGVDRETRNYYKRHQREVRVNGKLKIIRMRLYREGRNPILRAIRYVLMNAMFLLKAVHMSADMIFVQSTPPTQGAMAAVIKKLKKIPFVYNLQDVFPDSMVNAGMTKQGSLIWKIGRHVENFTYRNADKIIVISENMRQLLLEKGVAKDKIEVVYNWVETEKVFPISRKDHYLFDEYGLDRDGFYVVYAGNLGQVQNIDVILDAARLLEENSAIKFIIFGQGVLQEEYRIRIEREKRPNISIHDLLPYEKASYVYSLGNVGIVSCKKGYGGSVMPSKTCSIMAAGSAVVASFDEHTDLQEIIEDNKIGKFCRAGDAKLLAEAITELYEDIDSCAAMGQRAREYVEKWRSREFGVSEYVRIVSRFNI